MQAPEYFSHLTGYPENLITEDGIKSYHGLIAKIKESEKDITNILIIVGNKYSTYTPLLVDVTLNADEVKKKLKDYKIIYVDTTGMDKDAKELLLKMHTFSPSVLFLKTKNQQKKIVFDKSTPKLINQCVDPKKLIEWLDKVNPY
jgi:hypothetical protein